MAKGLILELDGEVSSFGYTKVDREKLYGRKERVVVDESGDRCSTAYLLGDGATVVPQGETSSFYADPDFDTVERSSLIAVDAVGHSLPLIPSTLGVAVPLTRVDARRILDHETTGVYQLAPETLGPKLREALQAGGLFETRMSFRDGYSNSTAFLLQNDQGVFVLLSDPLDFGFLAREAPPEVTEEEPDGGELDFNMM